MNDTLIFETINFIYEKYGQALTDAFERIDHEYLNIPVRYMIEKIINIKILKVCIFRGFKDFDKGLYWSVFYRKDFLVDYFINNLNANLRYAAMGAFRLVDYDLAYAYVDKYICKKFNTDINTDLFLDEKAFFYDDNDINIPSEVCSFGDVELFDKALKSFFSSQIETWANKDPSVDYIKVFVGYNFLGAAVESENIEMIDYVINNIDMESGNFQINQNKIYKKIIDVLLEKSNFPTIKLVEILNHLVDLCKKKILDNKFKIGLFYVFIKIGKFDIIKDEMINNIDNYIIGGYGLIKIINHFIKDKDFIENRTQTGGIIKYICLSTEEKELSLNAIIEKEIQKMFNFYF
jgi:hypothetical protein